MTTTITLTTHSWPVRVTTTDRYQVGTQTTTTVDHEDVPPNAERMLHITSTRSMTFEELPEPPMKDQHKLDPKPIDPLADYKPGT